MAPGYPFSMLEGESFFPNLPPNEVWVEGVVERVENGAAGGENNRPSVTISVTKACSERITGSAAAEDLKSAVPDGAINSEPFACPTLDLSNHPDVQLQKCTKRPSISCTNIAASGDATSGMTVTISGSGTIAAMIRSPTTQFVSVLEDGPFAQLKQINSLNKSSSVDDKTNPGFDVRVGAGEMVGVCFGAVVYNNMRVGAGEMVGVCFGAVDVRVGAGEMVGVCFGAVVVCNRSEGKKMWSWSEGNYN